MKYCSKCGSVIMDEVAFCPLCGCATGSQTPENKMVIDAPNAGIAFIGFILPLVGLILYLLWKDERPMRAKSAGKGALLCVVIAIVVSVLLIIIPAIALFLSYRR